jgi:hypothetical protein
MNWCTHISPWPSLHSTSLHLRTLHILTTVYFPSLNFTSLHFTSLHSTSLHLRTLHVLTTVYFPSLHFPSFDFTTRTYPSHPLKPNANLKVTGITCKSPTYLKATFSTCQCVLQASCSPKVVITYRWVVTITLRPLPPSLSRNAPAIISK